MSQIIRKWQESSLVVSARAVDEHPEAYARLQKLVAEARGGVNVISQYRLAGHIVRECSYLVEGRPGTIFYNSMKDIDPNIYGEPRTFKRTVRELAANMALLDAKLCSGG